MKILKQRKDLGNIQYALLDFDGTLSLIRQGWQGVMQPLMLEYLQATPQAEPEDRLQEIVRDIIAQTTGLQTIYQMIRLNEEVVNRGASEQDPMVYKREYLDRLDRHINDRIAGLKDGSIQPESLIVPGAREFLQALKSRGIVLCCASGTDEENVRQEAELLKLSNFFDAGIHGAQANYTDFSKKDVIRDILTRMDLSGSQLLVIGDGRVEIEEAVNVGAITVGIASDESALLENPSQASVYDTFKCEKLSAADILIPDFRDLDTIVSYLFDQ